MALEDLKQSENNLEVIGMVKSINLEKKDIKGKSAITGNVVVEVRDGERINNIRLDSFAYQYTKNGSESKLYKGLRTVSDEYKSKDNNNGEGDWVRVVGNISGNVYVSNDDLNESVRTRGTFYNRIDADEGKQQQKALAQVDLTFGPIVDKMDADGLPTGDKKVDAYFIEYGPQVGKVVDLEVHGELADQFDDLFADGDTASITMKINNYMEQKEEYTSNVGGFGQQANLGGASFTRNFEIIGGSNPFDGERAFEPEQVQEIKDLYAKRLETAKTLNSGSSVSAKSGFGTSTGATSNPFANASADDTDKSSDDGFAF